MKKILLILVTCSLSFMCSGDWSDEIDALRTEVENQKKLIEALQQNATISGIQQGDGSYTINFSNGESITLYNGKTPLIAIGANGNWTINGEDTGMPSQGQNGTTPSVTIGDNGNWFINGEDSGFGAKGVDGNDAPKITGIVENSDGFIFYFSDGSSVSCNKTDNIFAQRPASGYENFSVMVNYYVPNSESSSNTVQDGVSLYTDYGVIALPENYTTDSSKPTRLIILCQGTGERTSATTNPLGNHGWAYFLAKGYAVMDMNGMSADWGSAKGFPVKNQHYANKYLLQSYKRGYDYVMKKYNLHKEVFMMGISMGGGASMLLTQTGTVPVIAQANFCPAISVYKQDYMQPWGGVNQQKTIAGQWNFPDWASTAPSQEYFLQNIDKINGYDNLLINTVGDTKEQANLNYNNEAEKEAYYALSKYFPVPLKIWHCLDDGTVAFRYSDFFVKMVQNGGGRAWLRTMESGGHIGGWNNGKDTVYDTDINGERITTSVPFYEAMMFIQRYE